MTWSQQAYLKASNTGAGDFFGVSVAISGDTVVVGAQGEDNNSTGVNPGDNNSGPDSGAAYIFVRNGVTWTQQAYLKASNTGASDFFGNSVAVFGDTVVVGARGEDNNSAGVNPGDNNSGPDSGAAYVFVRNGVTWAQQAYLKASNTGAGDGFGYSVAASADTVVVGAYQEDSNSAGVNQQDNNSGPDSGAAYAFLTPRIQSGGVVSASSFGGSATVAPGSWIEIYGSGLATETREWSGSDFNGTAAPVALNGTSVTIGGQRAFVRYISPGQVNVQVPSNVAVGPQTIVVSTPNGDTAPVSVTVAASQPGLLAPASFQIGGRWYVAALHTDGTFVLPPGAIVGLATRQAQPGETILLYGIGFGSVTPNIAAGQVVTTTNRKCCKPEGGGLILCDDATEPTGTVQGATFRSRDHCSLRPLVPAVWAELPEPGGDDGRA